MRKPDAISILLYPMFWNNVSLAEVCTVLLSWQKSTKLKPDNTKMHRHKPSSFRHSLHI